MPSRFRLYPEHRLVFERAYGEVTVRGIVSGLREIAEHPDWSPRMSLLVDSRDAEISEIKLPFTHAFGQLFQELYEQPTRIALVNGAADGDTKMAATFTEIGLASGQSHRDGIEFKAFADMGDAVKWLGLPDDFEPGFGDQDE